MSLLILIRYIHKLNFRNLYLIFYYSIRLNLLSTLHEINLNFIYIIFTEYNSILDMNFRIF